jgi:hypothetical protein
MVLVDCESCQFWQRVNMRLPRNRYGRRSTTFYDCINQEACPRAKVAREVVDLEEIEIMERFT